MLSPEQIEQKVAEYRRQLEAENNPDLVERAIRRNRTAAREPNPLTHPQPWSTQ